MLLKSIEYTSSNEFFTCLKTTEYTELEITPDNLKSVDVKMIISNTDTLCSEDFLYKVKRNNVDFVEMGIILKFKLEIVQNPKEIVFRKKD